MLGLRLESVKWNVGTKFTIKTSGRQPPTLSSAGQLAQLVSMWEDFLSTIASLVSSITGEESRRWWLFILKEWRHQLRESLLAPHYHVDEAYQDPNWLTSKKDPPPFIGLCNTFGLHRDCHHTIIQQADYVTSSVVALTLSQLQDSNTYIFC